MKKKKYILIVSPDAELELFASKEFYEQQREGLGIDFINEVSKALDRIADNPDQFVKVKKNVRKVNLKRFPFAIYYAEKEVIIGILAIFHCSRNPKHLRKRL